MRIAFVVSEFPSVSQTFVADQLQGLVARGHQVDVIAETGHGGANPFVNVIGLGTDHWRRRRAALTSLLGMANRRPILSARLARRLGSRDLSAGGMVTAGRLVRNGPYDVVHAHFGRIGEDMASLMAPHRKSFPPLVTSFHGFDLSMYIRQHGPDTYRQLFRVGSRFLPVTDYWRRRLINLGAPERRIIVVPMGLDLQRFPIRSPSLQCLDGEPFRVLSVGRLTEKKGLRYGIAAISAVAAAGIDVTYSIIGDGALRGELRQQAQSMGVEDLVAFLGSQPRAKVLEAMACSDLLVVPSVTAADGDMEGLPVVLMEAMAMGVPVVATAHSGIPELVCDGVTGLLVAERDSAALATAMVRILARKVEVTRMVRQARREVERHHSLDATVDGLEAAYHAAMAGA